MPTTTPRLGLTRPALDETPDGPDALETLTDELDGIVAWDDQGILADRPVSTPGSPGIRGRYYMVKGDADATQNGRLYRDHGTGWDEVGHLFQRVAGRVASDGSRVFGAGFTPAHISPGKYTITFSPAFGAEPAVHALAFGQQFAYIDSIDASHVTFGFLFGGSGNLGDTAFDFVAQDRS